MPELIQPLHYQVTENPKVSVREMGVATMMLVLNGSQGTQSDSQGLNEPLDKGKEASEQLEASCWAGDDLILLKWKEQLVVF